MRRADRVSRHPGPRRRRTDGHDAWRSSATSSRRASAAATRACSAPCSASRPCSGRCSAATSSTTCAGAGSSTSTCRSALLALAVIAARSARRARRAGHAIDYLGAALLAVRADRARPVHEPRRHARYAWGSPADHRLLAALGVARSSLLRARRAAGRRADPAAAAVPQPHLLVDVRGRASSSASRCSARSRTCRSTCRSSRGASPTARACG